jgi:hypothetical protein
MKHPICPTCHGKSQVHYIREGKRWIPMGYYCRICDEVVHYKTEIDLGLSKPIRKKPNF